MRVNSFLFIVVAVLCSCDSNLSPEEYMAWAKDYQNGLHVRKEVNEYYFDLQYQPSAIREMLRSSSPNGEEMASTAGKEDGLQYYILEIGLNKDKYDFISYGTLDAIQKQQRLYYFSYVFQNDIYLEQNGERFSCILYHMENISKPSRTFVIAFENKYYDLKESTLVIDSGQFGNIPVKVRIVKNQLAAI